MTSPNISNIATKLFGITNVSRKLHDQILISLSSMNEIFLIVGSFNKRASSTV